MLHLLLDTAQFFLLLGSGPLFTAGNPALTLLLRFPPGTVIPISHSKGGGLTAGLLAQLLQMDDLVCHPFQQVSSWETNSKVPPTGTEILLNQRRVSPSRSLDGSSSRSRVIAPASAAAEP